MEFDILKTILQHSGQDLSGLCLDNCNNEIEDDKFQSRNPELTSALAKSLATLLSHRVSPAVHQRYLVRTNLIEQLRDWSRITSRYSRLHSFTDGEKTTKFTMRLVDKYLTEEFVMKQTSVNVLVKLGYALISMKLRNSTFEYKLDNIINRILYLDRTPDSDIYVDTLTDQYEDLSLALSTVENIYICRAEKLIEIPIIDCFISFKANHTDGSNDFETIRNQIDSPGKNGSHPVSRLLKYSSKSPRIFQLLSSILKEILARQNCCEMIVNFIRSVMNYISNLCKDNKNNVIDLYPRNLQCVVILLRIEPKLHTNNSKDYTLQKLKTIFDSNKQQLLILLTHFPLWIEEFSKFISDSDDLLSS